MTLLAYLRNKKNVFELIIFLLPFLKRKPRVFMAFCVLFLRMNEGNILINNFRRSETSELAIKTMFSAQLFEFKIKNFQVIFYKV